MGEREREERASASASTMHGRKREPKEVKYSEKRVEAKKKKAKLYGQLSKQVHERCIGQKNFDEDSLMLSAKLLEMNCELYSLWNYRKEYLKPKLQGEEGEEGERRALVERSLSLLRQRFRRTPSLTRPGSTGSGSWPTKTSSTSSTSLLCARCSWPWTKETSTTGRTEDTS